MDEPKLTAQQQIEISIKTKVLLSEVVNVNWVNVYLESRRSSLQLKKMQVNNIKPVK
jgi:hypothetical protein